MGFLDDIFDTKITDDDSRIKYAPMKIKTKKEIGKVKQSKERENRLKECATWVYINSVEWCIALKGTHIHQLCMEEIFDNLSSRKGVLYCEFAETLTPDWSDYWYEQSNHQYYNKQQLKKIEKEFDKGRDSQDLVYEMLQYVWFSMIPKDCMYDEIDDNGIYKLQIRYIK